jgi:hypothetical protein
MLIKYKPITRSTVTETNIVYRFYTDIVTEEEMCSLRDEEGNIIRCRTDYLVNLPLIPMSAEEFDSYVRSHCPVAFLEDEEKRILAKTETPDDDLSAMNTMIAALPSTEKSFIVQTRPKTNAEWIEYKKRFIAIKRDTLIMDGGIPLEIAGETYWFNTNMVSSSFHSDLALAALVAKGQGHTDDYVIHSSCKTMGGRMVDMTIGIALSLLSASLTQRMVIFNAAEAHYAAVTASSTAKSYSINAGWPNTYSQ